MSKTIKANCKGCGHEIKLTKTYVGIDEIANFTCPNCSRAGTAVLPADGGKGK